MTVTQLTLPIDPPRTATLQVWCPRHRWPATCGLCASWERWRMSRADVWYGYMSADQKRVTTWTGVVLGRITSATIGRKRWSRQGYYRMRYVQVTATDNSLWWGRASAEQDLIVMHRYGKGRQR